MMNKTVSTKRLYSFEENYILKEYPELSKSRSLLEIIEFSKRIFKNKKQPLIRFGKGALLGEVRHSFSEGNYLIEMAPGERNYGVFLHECAHTLGPNDKYDYGPAFVKRYFQLLKKYAYLDDNILFKLYYDRW